ncbi:hypothetical protein BGZ98_006970 [Dissophora globulifera]|nr:hypothetical protein BGZ98_006970 [Dissophora globulifera]
MPPLQESSTFELTAAIPFADHSPSSLDKLFDNDVCQPAIMHQNSPPYALSQNAPPPLPQPDLPVPSEAAISALFGLPPVQAPRQLSPPIAQRSAQTTPSPTAPPPAHHYSQQPQSQHSSYQSQEYVSVAPISTIQPNYKAPSLASSSIGPATQHIYKAVAPAPVQMPTFQSYKAFDPSPSAFNVQEPQLQSQQQPHQQQHYPLQPQNEQEYPPHQQLQQQQQQQQQYTSYQQYDPNRCNLNSYGVINTDYSSQYSGNSPYESAPSSSGDPLVLHAPARSFFSRLSGGAVQRSPGMSSEGHGTFAAPQLAKAAVSYVSSTLAVTSTFASEKLATASTKIADLWQHNQHVLPQQRQHHSQQQEQQQGALYNHSNYYTAADSSVTQQSTIISGGASELHQHQAGYFGGNNKDDSNSSVEPIPYSYGEQVLINTTNQNTSYNYQTYNNSNNIHTSTNSDNYNSGRNSFGATATSTLSNAASVAGSYLPSLSKLPALPALRALPALPTLPWGNRGKNQHLPQQQPHLEQKELYSQNQHYSTQGYSHAYEPSQYQTHQPQQQQQQQQQQQHYQGYAPSHYDSTGGILADTSGWWGGLRNEMQKGRRMVQTGVQVGVAWWWDSDAKNPMGSVV